MTLDHPAGDCNLLASINRQEQTKIDKAVSVSGVEELSTSSGKLLASIVVDAEEPALYT